MADGSSRLHTWFAELRRRKVFRVATVYLVAAWLAIQVADAVFDPMGLPGWTLKLVIVLLALGFPVACALAWAFDVTPQGIERTPAARPMPDAVQEPGTALPAPVAVPVAPPLPGPAVAILSFADLSPGRDQEYFCDGIAEEIVNALCCVSGLRIASRTSAAQYKGRSADVREIGKALGVGAVLEGSVRKAGNRVRITAQLVNAADGYHLWSESFDRGLEDVFATQTEIAQKLVRALRLSLTPQEAGLLERGGTRSAQAYDLYLRGQALLRDGSDTTLPQAAATFRSAREADPQFAQAHAGLANALAYAGIWGLDVDAAGIEEALAASRRALELEPRMPEAFVAKGNLLFMQGKAEQAFAAFEEAIRLNPSSYEAHYFYARDLFSAGHAAQAVAYYEVAERLRPEEYQPPCMLAGALFSLGRTEQARAAAGRGLHSIDARLRAEPDDSRALHLGAVLAARLGQRERALEYVRHALELRPDEFATAYNVACTYAVLGLREEALDMLDRAVSTGRGDVGWIEHDPDFDTLRGEERFGAIVGRLRAKGEGRRG
jgi:adenylate cyclase